MTATQGNPQLLHDRRVYETVEMVAQVRKKCSWCKGWVSRRQTFYQVRSLFNTNPDGSLKTKEQIEAELKVEVEKFEKMELTCIRCDGISEAPQIYTPRSRGNDGLSENKGNHAG